MTSLEIQNCYIIYKGTNENWFHFKKVLIFNQEFILQKNTKMIS